MAETNDMHTIDLPVMPEVCIATGADVARHMPDAVATDVVEAQPAVVLTLPPEGVQVAVEAQPGSTVELPAEFAGAVYTLLEEGLLIEPAQGGTVLIEGFRDAAEGTPPLLLVAADGQSQPADVVLGTLAPPQSVVDTTTEIAAGVPVHTDIEPGAGPEAPSGSVTGGGANFTTVEHGSLGDGLDVTGALGPTDLGRSVTFGVDRNGVESSSSDGGGAFAVVDGNRPPVAEPHKLVLLPEQAGSTQMNTHAATDADADTLIYRMGEMPDSSIATITIGRDGTVVESGQVLTEAEYLALFVDPHRGSAGTEFELTYVVEDGKGGVDEGSMLLRFENAMHGPWSETGGDGHDVIRGSFDDDVIDGGKGDDYLKGGHGEDQISGGEGDDEIHSSYGDDIISGGSGEDILVANEGDDVIIDDLAGLDDPSSKARYFGGSGTDTLRLDGDGLTLDLTQIENFRVQGIERIDLASGGNTVILDIEEVLRLSNTSDTVEIFGGNGDAVVAELEGATINSSNPGFTTYSFGDATLVIENTVDQSGIVV